MIRVLKGVVEIARLAECFHPGVHIRELAMVVCACDRLWRAASWPASLAYLMRSLMRDTVTDKRGPTRNNNFPLAFTSIS